MRLSRLSSALLLSALTLASASLNAQTDANPSEDHPVQQRVDVPGVSVPRLVKFSGTLRDPQGNALSGAHVVRFALYAEQGSESALWSESQKVLADESGRYTVTLGATLKSGIPISMFANGEARWLEIKQDESDAAQAQRLMLVSVPFALKAEDADKLGGRSASEFVLTSEMQKQVAAAMLAQSTSKSQANPPDGIISTTVQDIAPNGAVRFSDASTVEVVLIQQTGSGVALRAESLNSAIVGVASNSSGVTSGVLGSAVSPSGAGVRGEANGSSGGTGVLGIAVSPSGNSVGVQGEVNSGSGTAGLFRSNNAAGTILRGQGPGATDVLTVDAGGNLTTAGTVTAGGITTTGNLNVGGVNVPSASTNLGVVRATNLGTGAAIEGTAAGASNNAVYGRALGSNGVGVRGESTSLTGIAGVFNNTNGGQILSGQSASTEVFSVHSPSNSLNTAVVSATQTGSTATNPSLSTLPPTALRGQSVAGSGYSFGILGSSASPDGVGIVGVNTSTGVGGTGVFGLTSSTSGDYGVSAEAAATTGDAKALGGRVNSPTGIALELEVPSTTATLIRGQMGPDGSQVEVFKVDGAGVVTALGATFIGANGGAIGRDTINDGTLRVGVQGIADSNNGRGLIGSAPTTGTGNSIGVLGTASADNSAGVFGRANSATGTTSGVRGINFSSAGHAVRGDSYPPTANAVTTGGIGVYASYGQNQNFTTNPNASGGFGVLARNFAINGYGAKGEALADNGVGVEGVASGPNSGRGVRGNLFSIAGFGVEGVAQNASGTGIGVNGVTNASNGVGVRAEATPSTGSSRALEALNNGPGTVANFFALGSGTIISGSNSGGQVFTVGNTGAVTAAGIIRSTSGGIQFPDNTIQTTAAGAGTGVSTNTANTLVQRDGTGSFAAQNITANSFIGNGSALTGIVASNASSLGGVPAASFARNDISNSLSGNQTITGINVGAALTVNGAANPGTVLQLDNTSGGPLLKGFTGGTPKISIDGAGNIDTQGFFHGFANGVGNSAVLGIHNGTSSTGANYGVFGRATDNTGTGVHGENVTASGAGVAGVGNPGVVGTSPSGFGSAGIFNNTGGGNILLGQQNGSTVFSVNNSGLVTAAGFSGSGAGLTGITASSASSLAMPTTTNSTIGVITQNGARFLHSFGTDSVFLGANAGNFALSGNNNTGVGRSALTSLTDGFFNTATGAFALQNNTSGPYNTATGAQALSGNTSGNGNTGTGRAALFSNTIGNLNTATGHAALFQNTTGSQNTASGNEALTSNTTGNNNTAVGYLAGFTANGANANTTGSNNTFIGYQSGPGTPTQLTNATAIGANAIVAANNSLVLGNAAVSVGIGNTAPTEKLDVTGNIKASGTVTATSFSGSGAALTGIVASSASSLAMPTTTDSTTGVITSNSLPFIHNYGTDNTFVGVNAGNFSMTGDSNTAIGVKALFSNTSGVDNTATGDSALLSNTIGSNNTAHGSQALLLNTTGGGNAATGDFSLYNNTTGNYNTAIGSGTLSFNTIGIGNTALGFQAGLTVNFANANTTGFNNTFLGHNAGPGTPTQLSNATAVGAHALVTQDNSLILGSSSVSVGIGNTAPTEKLDVTGNIKASGTITAASLDLSSTSALSIGGANLVNAPGTDNYGFGSSPLGSISLGVQNNAFGRLALFANTTGNDNTAMGHVALSANSTGGGNSSFGSFALSNNSIGNSNSAFGAGSLQNTTASGNTGLGVSAGFANTTGSNNTFIGSSADAGAAGLTNATAIGANAVVTASNAMILGDSAVSVGIGNTAPTEKLDVAGNIKASGTVTATSFSGDGSALTGIVASSTSSLTMPTTSSSSVGVVTQNSVPFIHSFGTSNTFVGKASGNFSMTGTSNVALGDFALFSNSSGAGNAAIGSSALSSNTTGGSNTGVGSSALANSTTGNANVAVGTSALSANTTGGGNVAVGSAALFFNSTSFSNVAVGEQALFNTTGAQNTALGGGAGQSNTTGAQNTFLGYNTNAGASGLTNATAIGANAIVGQSNAVVLGNGADVGIGTSTPGYKLAVVADAPTNAVTHIFNSSLTGGTGLLVETNALASTTAILNNIGDGNILEGQDDFVPVFRVDGTGKGFFNGGTQTGGADFAESMAVSGPRETYQPGDVMVIDPDDDRQLMRSSMPYSTMVAGIYSTKPGVLATPHVMNDPRIAESEIPLAVVGIVPCKVSTENGPIRRGDLLVTSSRTGYAMKGTDRSRMLGAIVGKALQTFNGKTGVIEVLVTLQ